jgi:glutamyl-tRNA(Gln) amidotransferase subunit E
LHDAEYYKKLGFKCGLEIHQRLATERKLFCSCSAAMRPDRIIGKVERRQRAVAGELGAIDRSTSFESNKGRGFVYNVFERSSCLVDLDEEPPHRINMEAVEAGLRLSSSFNVKIPDEIEPMRKEVVDGSDPSAFQRSMMIAHDGSMEVDGKRIRISSVFLEEESSGIESSNPESVVYNTDRLGVPLIEVDTDPDITSPKQAKEVALRIGMLLRLTGKKNGGFAKSEVQRGIGTIRQDVNVSIEGGTRVEVKGLQQIDGIDLIIENEVERQVRLLEIKKKLVEKKASVGEAKDLAKILKNSKAKMIKEALKNGNSVMGVGLYGFGGIVGHELGADRRLGSEISDYAKMSGVRGIIHSDEELSKYGFGEAEIEEIRGEFGLGKDDAFMLVTAQREMCERAIGYAIGRAKMAMAEVPPETRAVVDAEKGTTRFMRPLPGGSRMYPETDAEPIVVTREYYNGIVENTVYMDERVAMIRKDVNNAQLAGQLIGSTRLAQYEYIASKSKCDRLVVATTILERIKEIERSGVVVNVDDDVMVDIFNRYANGEITKAGIVEVIRALPEGRKEVDCAIKKNSLERISGAKLGEIVRHAKAKEKGEVVREIMARYRLNVDGDELKTIIGV